MPTDETRTEKRALRAAVLAARAAYVAGLNAAARQAAAQALAQVAVRHLRGAAVVASYAAYGDEIDPSAIETALLAAGSTIAFPRVSALGQPLTFHRCTFADLQPGFRGIAEPPADAPEVHPDVVLVPLTAVDAHGNRIGQGAGLYDRTLALRRVATVGLAWPAQIVRCVPASAWDVPLDAVASPDGWLQCCASPFAVGGMRARR
jgi:5-formyltetrahydrofolate cyclo-ligase